MATILEIQTCINNLTTASDAAEFAILATEAVRETSNNLSFSVATVAALPDLLTTNTPNGQVVFVVSLAIPVIASKLMFEWRGMDGRLIRKDGVSSQLWTWGDNAYATLGTNTTPNRSSPGTTSGGGSTWCQLSAGRGHSSAVKTDGTLWTWGSNSSGQLGNNTTINRSSPGTTAGGGTTWRTVSAGFAQVFSIGNPHTAGIKTDGTLWTWGGNANGRLGDGTTTSRLSPGTTVGPNCCDWCSVSTGFSHTAAIKTNGTLWTWGYNSNGQLGDGTVTSRTSPVTTAGPNCCDWCQISAGISNSTLAVKTNGTLWTWGCNTNGQLGNNTTINRSSPGTTAGPNCCNWCAASSGDAHSAAVKTDGTLWTWGSNSTGRLGTNSTTNRSSPGTTAGGGTTWCQTSAGGGFSTAVKTDGTLWVWGSNTSGRLGDGTTTDRSSPVTTVGGCASWCAVSSGFSHTMAISAC